MKIYMQIPYAGSEFDPPEHRQSQATATGHLTGFAASELSALKLLTEKACPSTPTLLDYKHDIQGPEGLVPGGFVFYLLMNKLPGRRLRGDFFWRVLDESGERGDSLGV
ncbi:hypothetical protein VTN96DRAFT_7560 [Rasamsonia emersonii]